MKDTPFFMERARLLEGTGGPIDQKHGKDRTTSLVRKYRASEDALRRDRAATLGCLAARPGKGGAVVFEVVDSERFDRLQEAIAGHAEELKKLEGAITEIDSIVAANRLPSWFDDMKQRLNSSSNSIYTQKNMISQLVAFNAAQNPQLSPEEVLELPEFTTRRKEADDLIKREEEYLANYRPIVEQIEAILESAGC